MSKKAEVRERIANIIEKGKRIPLTVSTGYVKNWDELHALREIVQELVDNRKEKMEIRYEEGFALMSHDGKALETKHLVFGNSSKTEEQIGFMGEGFKLAVLVLARAKKLFFIQSAGFDFTARMEYDRTYESELVVFYIKKNDRSNGVKFTVECDQKVLEQAKNLYFAFDKTLKKLDEQVYLPGGKAYVGGLNVGFSYPLLFTLYFKTKGMFNRDRTIIDIGMANEETAKILANLTNEEAIKMYLTAWQNAKGKRFFEYEVSFRPRALEVWKRVARKVFGEKVAISSGYFDQDAIAYHMGYNVLNPPHNMSSVLRTLGAKHASDIAEFYKGGGIMQEGKIVFPMTKDYIKTVGLAEGIREIISNALDEHTKTNCKWSAKYKDGKVYVSDQGRGVELKHFVMGAGEGGRIGQFHEGLVVAALSFARAKKSIEFFIPHYTIRAKMERDTRFNIDVLVLEYKPSKKRSGTEVVMQATADEWEMAKRYFVELSRPEELAPGILAKRGAIYVSGVKVYDAPNCRYGYNLPEAAKSLIPRDRNMVDMSLVSCHIANLWAQVAKRKVVEEFLKAVTTDPYVIESNLEIPIRPTKQALKVWKGVASKLFHKCCLASGQNSEYDLVALDKGYKVLRNLTSSVIHLLSFLGVKFSHDVARLPEKKVTTKSNKVKLKDLTPLEKLVWRKARSRYRQLFPKDFIKEMSIVKEFPEDNPANTGQITMGMWDSKEGEIILRRTILNNFEKTMGVILHEHIHAKSGASDRTREFENALTDMIGFLACRGVKL